MYSFLPSCGESVGPRLGSMYSYGYMLCYTQESIFWNCIFQSLDCKFFASNWYSSHTWQPSLFGRESPSLEGSLLFLLFSLFPPFLGYHFLFDKNWQNWWYFTLIIPFLQEFCSISDENQPENDHSKILRATFEVMSGNLQNIGVKQLKQTKFGHLSTPMFDIFNLRKTHQPQNR